MGGHDIQDVPTLPLEQLKTSVRRAVFPSLSLGPPFAHRFFARRPRVGSLWVPT